MAVKIDDKLPAFKRSVMSVMDDAVREGGRDILIKAKTRAPFSKGSLRSQSDVHRLGFLKQRVSFWMEYARFQEFGGDSKRRVRNYTTGGTGAHYLEKSGDEVAQRIKTVFIKHGRRARP